jgi:hypothetical protein
MSGGWRVYWGVADALSVRDRAAEVYWSAVRAMSLEQKLRVAEGLRQVAWQMQANQVRARHPDWSLEEVEQQVREVFLRVGS